MNTRWQKQYWNMHAIFISLMNLLQPRILQNITKRPIPGGFLISWNSLLCQPGIGVQCFIDEKLLLVNFLYMSLSLKKKGKKNVNVNSFFKMCFITFWDCLLELMYTEQVGKRKLITESGITIPIHVEDFKVELEESAKTGILVAYDYSLIGVLGVADPRKREAAVVVEGLK